MIVYRVDAVNNDHQSLVPALDLMPAHTEDPRMKMDPDIPDDWSPPPLVHFGGKRKLDVDFWDYDQGTAFAVSDRAAQRLTGEAWCKLIPFTAEAFDAKLRPTGTVRRVLLVTTLLLDAIDRSRTRFKPYGDEILDFDRPGSIVFREDALPTTGLFRQRSGNSSVVFCAEDSTCVDGSFKSLCATEGWTGLKFRPV